MKKTSGIIAAIVVSFASSAFAGEWQLDASHSHVGFWVKHLGVTKVKGDFKEFTATIQADDKSGKIESLEATAKVASINTQNEKRDEHLKADDFFNAAKFPEAKLKTKAIKWNKDDSFTADVDVTIRDVTKTVKFTGTKSAPGKVNWGQGPVTVVGYTAAGKINRKDFNIGWNKMMEAVAVVSDEVNIELDIEISKKAEEKK